MSWRMKLASVSDTGPERSSLITEQTGSGAFPVSRTVVPSPVLSTLNFLFFFASREQPVILLSTGINSFPSSGHLNTCR